jgi:CubicO group peptidase (beta-lactamase class C family)
MMRLQATQHSSLPDGFGLGFGVQGEPDRRMVWWDGFVPGATSRLALLPDHAVGVAILTNSGDALLVQAISKRVFDLLVGPVQYSSANTGVGLDDIVGEYRLIDIMEPALWYVKWLPLFAVEAHGGLLELGLPFVSGTVTLHPTGPMRYRVEGALFDGLTVFFEEKHLYIHMLEAERVPGWGSSKALLAYFIVLILLTLALVGFGLLRLGRRLRS